MKKLYIFSYGLHPGQLTLETLAAMKSCGAVYTHCLDKDTAGRLAGLAPGLTLNSGLGRRQTAAAVVAALDRHDTVGFLTYGNPLFMNRAAAEVMDAAARKKAQVTVLAGVSSFDALVNLFDLNQHSRTGLRLVDTAGALDKPYFTPEMDTLFFVPYVLNLAANAPALRAFLAAAKKAYPPGAPAYLAACSCISHREPEVIKGKVAGLPGLLKKINERHTLFIPASKR